MCGTNTVERAPRVVADDKRASDAEREATISDLRAHAAEGRVGLEELDERVAKALAATTRADLAALTADLPRARRARDRGRAQREFRDHLRTYMMVMALLVAIWALTGAGYFWPVWPMVGWGVVVAPDALAARRRGQLN